jgi:hypothetical protein
MFAGKADVPPPPGEWAARGPGDTAGIPGWPPEVLTSV